MAPATRGRAAPPPDPVLQVVRGEGAEAWIWVLWVALLCWAVTALVASEYWSLHTRLLLSIGAIASWRYAWGLLHLLRAVTFLGAVFPKLRRRAAATDPASAISHVYGVVCSFDIPETQFRAVYTALVTNCLDAGLPATIVAAVTSDRDCAILGEILAQFGDPPGVRFIAQFQQGNGKRSAMGAALRAISREHPDERSVTLMLDGDVVLQRGALLESLRFLAADPTLAALTTNNDARLSPDDPARHWYWLRFAQRHMLMSSLSLSRRLLVLTGRYSVYRTSKLCEPGAIDTLENDHIDHWLHGRIRFLSGDDKSLWYCVLRHGGNMLYLPHVKAVSYEALPSGAGFLGGSTRLMQRWLGNTVRANGRAMALGPWRCGWFLWWCLLDQRLSTLSTLFGVSVAACLALSGHLMFLPLYLSWLVLSRSLISAVYGGLWGYYHPSWPLFLAYNQIWGGLLKLYLFFRPDRQFWTRQRIGRQGSTWFRQASANIFFIATVVGLLALAATSTRVLAGL